MKYLTALYIFILCSCHDVRWATVEYKLEDGTKVKDMFQLSTGKGFTPNCNPKIIFYTNVINEVAEGNKNNINTACYYGNNETVINSILLTVDLEEKHYNAIKFLLEQGADPNITKTYIFGKSAPFSGKKDDRFDPKTKKLKVRLPLTYVRPITNNYPKHLIYSLNALFLTFGSKINLKDMKHWAKQSVYEIWKEDLKSPREFKDFLFNISKEMLKLKNRHKLDPDFLQLLKDEKIDKDIIAKLGDYVKK